MGCLVPMFGIKQEIRTRWHFVWCGNHEHMICSKINMQFTCDIPQGKHSKKLELPHQIECRAVLERGLLTYLLDACHEKLTTKQTHRTVSTSWQFRPESLRPGTVLFGVWCCLCVVLPLNAHYHWVDYSGCSFENKIPAQWDHDKYSNFHHFVELRGRASESWLREPGFESCAAVLKLWSSVFYQHWHQHWMSF